MQYTGREVLQQPEFLEYTRSIVDHYELSFIAEEYEESMQHIVDGKTALKKLVIEIGSCGRIIAHQYCDLGIEGRKRFGIDSESIAINDGISTRDEPTRLKCAIRERDPIREAYWLVKLRPLLSGDGLFVCGSDHLRTFKSLLEAWGYEACILPMRFENETEGLDSI